MENNKWLSKISAKKYEYYANKYPMYRKTGQFMVKLANVNKKMTIADLGCGTGITTLEILKKIGNSGNIIAVDFSREMLNIAKKKIRQKNVCFIKSQAEKISKIIKSEVDVVLCNSAFWQMNINKALESVHHILKRNGIFIFNFPDQHYKFTKGFYFKDIVKKIAVEEFGKKLKTDENSFKQMTYKEIKYILRKNSFTIVKSKTLKLKRSIEDVKTFLEIPSIAQQAFPGLMISEQLKLINKISQIVNRRKPDEKWIYFVVKKI